VSPVLLGSASTLPTLLSGNGQFAASKQGALPEEFEKPPTVAAAPVPVGNNHCCVEIENPAGRVTTARRAICCPTTIDCADVMFWP